jgi:hypothetical protein
MCGRNSCLRQLFIRCILIFITMTIKYARVELNQAVIRQTTLIIHTKGRIINVTRLVLNIIYQRNILTKGNIYSTAKNPGL